MSCYFFERFAAWLTNKKVLTEPQLTLKQHFTYLQNISLLKLHLFISVCAYKQNHAHMLTHAIIHMWTSEDTWGNGLSFSIIGSQLLNSSS